MKRPVPRMTSAITNPCHEETIKAVMGADAMMGQDAVNSAKAFDEAVGVTASS